jgi:hypothetical protein
MDIIHVWYCHGVLGILLVFNIGKDFKDTPKAENHTRIPNHDQNSPNLYYYY